MNISKAKLPKGLSYPVKSGTIVTALEEAGATLDCTINYLNNPRTGFAAHFWPPNANIGFERLYLTIGAVSSEEVAEIRRSMSDSVLPEFVSWVLSIVALPIDSPVRREEQVFHMDFFD